MTLLSTSSNLSFCSGCADPSSYLFHISHHLAYILFGQTPPFYSSLTMGKSHPTSTQCTRFFYQSELLFNSSTDGCDENRHQWVNNCISMDADNPKHLGQRPSLAYQGVLHQGYHTSEVQESHTSDLGDNHSTF